MADEADTADGRAPNAGGEVVRYPAGHHPNSRGNLRSWRPGESGNPGGMPPPAGVNYERWKCHLAERTIPELERIHDDPKTSAVKKAAAADLLVAASRGKRFVKGKDGTVQEAATDPEPGRVRERIADRALGKPGITIQHLREPTRKPAELGADFITLVRSDPRLVLLLWPRILGMVRAAPTLKDQLRPLLAQHYPDLAAALDPIDVEAEELPVTQAAGPLSSPTEHGNTIVEDIRAASRANEPADGEADLI